MPDQILAVYKNFLKPRATAVDAGDLVLTDQRLCFVRLAAWEPNVNANPLRTAIAGTVGGFGAAFASTIHSVRSQNPEIAKLLADANKMRDTLWGMNIDERLSKMKSTFVIPIGEMSFEKSSDGIAVSVKDKRFNFLQSSHSNSFELHPTEMLSAPNIGGSSEQGAISALQEILLTWKSHQLASQTVEGYSCRFLAPQLFLDALVAGSSEKGKWQESEMLGDSEYLEHLHPLFKQMPYRHQCLVLSTLRNISASELASSLHPQLIASLREQLEKAIREEVSIWFGIIGVPLSIVGFLGAIVFIVLANLAEHNSEQQNSALGSMSGCLILLFFSAIAAKQWAVPFVRAKNARSRLEEQGVNPQKVEAESRVATSAISDSERSFPLSELSMAFSTDVTKKQFFKKLYSTPWRMQNATFLRFQGIAETNMRVTLVASAKAEGNRRKWDCFKCITFGLLSGGIVWLAIASVPPHGYGPEFAPFIIVLAVAIFLVLCGLASLAFFITCIVNAVAACRYGRVAKALAK